MQHYAIISGHLEVMPVYQETVSDETAEGTMKKLQRKTAELHGASLSCDVFTIRSCFRVIQSSNPPFSK